jgi:alanine racemase
MTPESSTTSDTTALRAWVDVDLGALVRNARALMAHARVPLLPMVKADAYGLGAAEVARALQAVDPWAFGVATVPEGAALRAAGIRDRVLVFTPLLAEELGAARDADLTPTLGDPAAIDAWQRTGASWHLAVDTGMNRAGVAWDRVGELADLIRAHPPEGVFTHYHTPDDMDAVAGQDRRFAAALEAMPVRAPFVHTDNSAAIVRRTRQAHDLVRPGVFLYGVGSGPDVLAPEAVAHLRARILEIHDVGAGEFVSYGGTWCAETFSRIATVALGYADGYRRHLSNRGRALIAGTEVSVVGAVTMDMTLIDVTHVPCAVGDVVTLIGRDGDRQLSVEAVAMDGGLSPYELLTGLSARAPRVYRRVASH